MPQIENIINLVGCKYLYLFAADEELSSKAEEYSLIRYYRTLGFSEVIGLKILKPFYDRGCFSMLQSIGDLLRLRNSIWNRYEDEF